MDTLKNYLKSLSMPDKIQYAKRCGTTLNYLRRAMSGKVEFKAPLCIALERESSGKVRCEDLIPKADWAYLRRSEVTQ